MPNTPFFTTVEVRYGDLDPQGHVNNAKYLSFLEQARLGYFAHLGLWDGKSFLDLSIILAEVRLTFKAAILYGQKVKVDARIVKLGNKSITMEHRLVDAKSGQEFADAICVLVAYNYRNGKTTPISEKWRNTINDFEKL